MINQLKRVVGEEPVTLDELEAIRLSEIEFAEGKFKSWDEIKSHKQ